MFFFKKQIPLIKEWNIKEKILVINEVLCNEVILEKELAITRMIIIYIFKKSKGNSSTRIIEKMLQNGKVEIEHFSNSILRMNSDKLKKWIIDQSGNSDSLYKAFKFKSGSVKSGVSNSNVIDEIDKSKNAIVKILINNIVSGNLDKERFYLEVKTIHDNQKILNREGFWNQNMSFLTDIKSKDLADITNKKKELKIKELNVDGLIDYFYFKIEREYKYLIKSWIFFTGFFRITNKYISFVNNELKELWSELIKNEDHIHKYQYDTSTKYLLESLCPQIKTVLFKDVDSINYLIQNKWNNEFYIKFIEDNLNNDQSTISSNIQKIVKENGWNYAGIESSTFFEYIIGIFFFKIIYKEELSKGINLSKVFRDTMNMKFNNDFIPIRFAQGGIADIVTNSYIIEPTLQIKNQIKMEINSILNHLSTHNKEIAFLVSPKIEKDYIYPFVYTYKHLNKHIVPIDFKLMLSIMDYNSRQLSEKNAENNKLYKNWGSFREPKN